MPDDLIQLVAQQNKLASDLLERLPTRPSGKWKVAKTAVGVLLTMASFFPLWALYDNIIFKWRANQSFYLLMSAGDVLLKRGDFEAARARYEEALKIYPGDSTALANLLESRAQGLAIKYDTLWRTFSAEEKEEIQRFVADCYLLVRMRPKDARAFRLLGLSLQLAKRYDESVDAFQNSLKLNPNDHVAHNQLGMTYSKRADLKRGDLDKAIECFTNAVELASKAQIKYARAYNNRGYVFLQQQRHVEAKQDFENALSIDNAFYGPYANLGTLFMERVKSSARKSDAETQRLVWAAKKNFLTAIVLQPENPNSLYNLATVFLNEKNFAAALMYYDRAAKLDPRDAGIHKNRGAALTGLGKYNEAIEEFSLAVALDPKDADNYKNRALLYRKLKPPENEKAVADEQSAAVLKGVEQTPEPSLEDRPPGAKPTSLGKRIA